MSYQTLETKITQVCNKANTLEADIANINDAFEKKGVEVGNTPSEEYGSLLTQVEENQIVKLYENKATYEYAFYNSRLKLIPFFNTGNASNFHRFMLQAAAEEMAELDFSKADNMSLAFSQCPSLKTLPNLNTVNATNFSSTFYACWPLETIQSLNISNATTTSGMFNLVHKLKNIEFIGTIPISISFANCSLLTTESVNSIINALKDLIGQTAQTLTFHATVGNALTDGQKATISSKNWTLVY